MIEFEVKRGPNILGVNFTDTVPSGETQGYLTKQSGLFLTHLQDQGAEFSLLGLSLLIKCLIIMKACLTFEALKTIVILLCFSQF